MNENSKMKVFADFMEIIGNALADKRFAIMIFTFFNLTLSFIILCINLPVGAAFLGAFGLVDVFMIGMSQNL